MLKLVCLLFSSRSWVVFHPMVLSKFLGDEPICTLYAGNGANFARFPGFKILRKTVSIQILLSGFPHQDSRLGIQKNLFRILNLESRIQDSAKKNL